MTSPSIESTVVSKFIGVYPKSQIIIILIRPLLRQVALKIFRLGQWVKKAAQSPKLLFLLGKYGFFLPRFTNVSRGPTWLTLNCNN